MVKSDLLTNCVHETILTVVPLDSGGGGVGLKYSNRSNLQTSKYCFRLQEFIYTQNKKQNKRKENKVFVYFLVKYMLALIPCV